MKKLSLLLVALILLSAAMGCSSGTAPAPSSSPSASASKAPSSASPSASAVSSPSPSSAASVTLTIAAAASLTDPLNEIIKAYKAVAPNITVTVSYGASGTLQTQIEQGAPADIFFSAAAKQMEALDKGGLIVTATKVNLLKNEIVLIVPSTSTSKILGFADVATDAVGKIALGDPKSVPAGQYAQDTFTYLKLWDKVAAKVNQGTDVKQVLTWVKSGNVDCGVVYKTDAISDAKVKIITQAPDGSHAPVIYPVAVVKASKVQDAAQAFIKYMQSASGMSVFTKYGFLAS